MLISMFRLILYQAPSIAALMFFYAVLVIWPTQDEMFQLHVKPNKIKYQYLKWNPNFIGRKQFGKSILDRCITPNKNLTLGLTEKAKHTIRTTVDPVIVWWTDIFPGIEDRYCPSGVKCKVFSSQFKIDHGAYLFYASWVNFKLLPLPRRAERIIWGLFHEESPRNIPALMNERCLNIFNFSSTYSRYSDVPMPLAHAGSVERITSKAFYYVETARKNRYIEMGLAPVLYIQTYCDTSTERDDYVRELFKYIDIDSYGSCLNNKKLPTLKFGSEFLENLHNDKFLKFIARYKFTIAIENSVCNDYITEKLWRPINVGSVPIYFGSPTVRDWLPNNKSAILLEDYRTPKALSEHLKKVLADDNLYEEYLEHKTKGIITNQRFRNELKIRPYQTDYSRVRREFECFICDKLHNIELKREVKIVNKSHYDCPKPISALSLRVNPLNKWVHYWDKLKSQADELYYRIYGNYN